MISLKHVIFVLKPHVSASLERFKILVGTRLPSLMTIWSNALKYPIIHSIVQPPPLWQKLREALHILSYYFPKFLNNPVSFYQRDKSFGVGLLYAFSITFRFISASARAKTSVIDMSECPRRPPIYMRLIPLEWLYCGEVYVDLHPL